jgi:lipopolysaccharide transport system ATP-binding protein
MKDVAGEGRTVIFVSHSMPSVKALCTQAIWLDRGKIVKSGKMEEVTDAYSYSSVSHDGDLTKIPRVSKVSSEAEIVKLSITSKGQKGDLIDPTKELDIEFIIRSKKDIDRVVVHCGITNSGQTVLRFMSEYTDKSFNLKKGINKIICSTSPANITGGIYGVDCSIQHEGREGAGLIDEIFDATSISVKEYPVLSGESFLTHKEACYYLGHTWKQENTN